MSIKAYEGIVELGQIKLKEKIRLPDKTRVYVVIPDFVVEGTARVATPRLANPAEATDFKMELIEEPSDARL
jgi:hypothetical protein